MSIGQTTFTVSFASTAIFRANRSYASGSGSYAPECFSRATVTAGRGAMLGVWGQAVRPGRSHTRSVRYFATLTATS